MIEKKIKFKLLKPLFYRKFRLKFFTNKPKIFLFGTIEHMNLGDEAISFSETAFLRRNASNFEVIEIPERLVEESLDVISSHICDEDVVMFHGGGNMGDTWVGHEEQRRLVFERFTSNKVVSFPQSINYNENSSKLVLMKNVLRQKNNITLIARDKYSFEQMKKFFPDTDIKLTPDIVLSLEREKGKKRPNNKKVTTFMRHDVEKSDEVDLHSSLLRQLEELGYKINNSDTVQNYSEIITIKNRGKILDKKWQEFRESEFIVTDRLHGMIFAYITNTPALVFDNSNHKVSNLYKTWLSNSTNIFLIDNNSYNLTEIIKNIKKIDGSQIDSDLFENIRLSIENNKI